MLIPVMRRIVENRKCFLERALPTNGAIRVKIGDKVEPFDRVGDCVFCQNEIIFASKFRPKNFSKKPKYYHNGVLMGTMGRDKVVAPFNGTLNQVNGGFTFREEDKKYILLSGVWGIVNSIINEKSVLLETHMKDILVSVCTPNSVSGELVVLPNPTDILKKSYLEKYSKGIKGKIVYVGNNVGEDILKITHSMGAACVLAGSSTKDAFNYAKSFGLSLGLISGFGSIDTPLSVYKALSSVSYRYVFFEGITNTLRIPVPFENVQTILEDPDSTKIFKEIMPGMSVQVLQGQDFGKVGTVDSLFESGIFVKFDQNTEGTKVSIPNFVIVE